MIKVLMVSDADYAGSGNRIIEAVERAGSNVRLRLLVKNVNRYGYPFDYEMKYINKRWLSNLARGFDLIHFKGDHLPKLVWHGVNLGKKPFIVTVGGSGFRRAGSIPSGNAKEWHSFEEYINRTILRTCLTPDLNYPDFEGIYTQHGIDSKAAPYTWGKKEIPVIQHSPSNRGKKGTEEFIIPALEILKNEGYKFEFDLLENISNYECVERKKRATIFIDQMNEAGMYGMSAVESMQYGIPVICHINAMTKKQARGKLDDCPVQSVERSIESLASLLRVMLEHDLTDLSRKTKTWANEFHGYETVGKMWSNIYNEVFEKYVDKFEKFINKQYFNLNEIKMILVIDRKGNIEQMSNSTANELIKKGAVKFYKDNAFVKVKITGTINAFQRRFIEGNIEEIEFNQAKALEKEGFCEIIELNKVEVPDQEKVSANEENTVIPEPAKKRGRKPAIKKK